MPPKKYIPTPTTVINKQVKVNNYKSEDEEMLEINEVNLTKNFKILTEIRTFGAINAGILSGLFNVSGLGGTICYLFVFFLVSIFLIYKTQFKVQRYFLKSSTMYYGGIFSDILLYIMIWVISHNIINIL